MSESLQQRIQRFEHAHLWAWPPRETAYVCGWILRFGGASSRRLNSVQTLAFEEGADLERAVGRVEAWYAQREHLACFQLTDGVRPPELDRFLEERGYRRKSPTGVYWRDLNELPPADVSVEIETRPRTAVMQAIADPQWDEQLRAERAAVFERIRRPLGLAVLFEGPEPVAGGACVVVEEIAVLHSLHTQYPYRGRGYGKSVVARLLGWAKAMGAREAITKIEEGNEASERLFAGFRFTRCYGYHYRER